MSTLRVNTLQNTSTTDGGISIDTSGHVTVDGQVLPSAGPLSNRNLVINGAMQVAQRATQVTGVTTGDYRTCDRFRVNMSNLGTWTIDQDTNAPNGFSNSFKITCTTADASPDANDNIFCTYFVEAQDLQSLAYGTSDAQAVTLSFWVRSNKTGNATFAIHQDDNSNKLASYQYSISSADTWEHKTITIPGDTAGVINNDNGIGLNLEWWLNGGSTFEGGSHQATYSTFSNTNRNPSNLGVGGATSDYFAITGVQLEVGSVATPFEHRSYGDELLRCQRYYQHYTTDTASAVYLGMGIAAGSTSARMFMPLAVPMRTTPSITENGASADDQIDSTYPLSSPQVVASTASTVRVQFTASSMTGGRPIQLQVGPGESITLSAEL